MPAPYLAQCTRIQSYTEYRRSRGPAIGPGHLPPELAAHDHDRTKVGVALPEVPANDTATTQFRPQPEASVRVPRGRRRRSRDARRNGWLRWMRGRDLVEQRRRVACRGRAEAKPERKTCWRRARRLHRLGRKYRGYARLSADTVIDWGHGHVARHGRNHRRVRSAVPEEPRPPARVPRDGRGEAGAQGTWPRGRDCAGCVAFGRLRGPARLVSGA